MFYLKTLKTIRKTRKKNICSFLAVVFCTLVIVSSIGTSFGIQNSYAQAQQQQLQPRQKVKSTVDRETGANKTTSMIIMNILYRKLLRGRERTYHIVDFISTKRVYTMLTISITTLFRDYTNYSF